MRHTLTFKLSLQIVKYRAELLPAYQNLFKVSLRLSNAFDFFDESYDQAYILTAGL